MLAYFFQIFFHPARRFSACSFNKSEKYFLPARLFRPACLLSNFTKLTTFDHSYGHFLPARLLDFRKNFHPAGLFQKTFFKKYQSACLFLSAQGIPIVTLYSYLSIYSVHGHPSPV